MERETARDDTCGFDKTMGAALGGVAPVMSSVLLEAERERFLYRKGRERGVERGMHYKQHCEQQ